mgnify:FL=1
MLGSSSSNSTSNTQRINTLGIEIENITKDIAKRQASFIVSKKVNDENLIDAMREKDEIDSRLTSAIGKDANL